MLACLHESMYNHLNKLCQQQTHKQPPEALPYHFGAIAADTQSVPVSRQTQRSNWKARSKQSSGKISINIFDAPLFNLRCAPLERLHGFPLLPFQRSRARVLEERGVPPVTCSILAKSTRESADDLTNPRISTSTASEPASCRKAQSVAPVIKTPFQATSTAIVYSAEIYQQLRIVFNANTALA